MITKKIDEFSDDPNITFKKLDALANGTENEKKSYEELKKLEAKYPELFRLARAFEDTPRGYGVHPSGILVTPMPVSDLFPLRYDTDGTAITLYTGTQLEAFQAVKYDILGLKTVSVIQKALHSIDPDITLEDVYNSINLDDPDTLQMIADKKMDTVFQLGSDMMKGLSDQIKPTAFNDIVAITSIGRPGPLSAGLNATYANGKNKGEIEWLLRGCENILGNTFGAAIYQEQLMAISKQVSGFDDSQADSMTRKVLAKKRQEMMPMLIRSHIYGKKNCEGPKGWETNDKLPWYDPKGKYGKEIPGALINGYTEQEMLEYFKRIEGFASYAFNKSHAASYSVISVITAWLKLNYPVEYMAAYLTMAGEDEFTMALQLCKAMNIQVKVPDIRKSQNDFTPDPENKSILFGLGMVKGVGETSIPAIIENAPYTSLEDAFNRIPKKAFNKRVATALINSGAFDFENTNRYELINKFMDLRGDKEERLDPEKYDEATCIALEDETLSRHITYQTWWEEVSPEETYRFNNCEVKKIREHTDKKGSLMAFMTITIDDIDVEAICFASKYKNLISIFDTRLCDKIDIVGKKTEKGDFIINDAMPSLAS